MVLVNCTSLCTPESVHSIRDYFTFSQDANVLTNLVEEACPAVLHHSGFSCRNHQKTLVGDFHKRTLS